MARNQYNLRKMETKTEQLERALERWQQLQPLNQYDQEKFSRRFSVDFNYNSNHIEGNTLTYGQTELLLLFGRVVQEAEMKDLEEMKASDVGLKMMTEEATQSVHPLTETFIRQLHKTLLREDYEVYRNLPGGVTTSYTIHAGQYKTRPNSVITRYGDRFDYASPEETPALMSDLVWWYREEEAKKELTPIELAILFHYRYIRIHPFEDGNGRIARLLVNFILARHNYPMVVVRSRKKQKYLEALHRADLQVGKAPSDGAHATLEQIQPFYNYFVQLMTEEINGYVDFLTEKNPDIWWFDGERVTFNSPTVSIILDQMRGNPNITQAELVSILGIQRSAVQKTMKLLIDKGYVVQRQGRYKWHVVITRS